MHCDVAATDWDRIEADWLIVGVPQQEQLPRRLAEFDQTLGGLLTRLQTNGDLTGEAGDLVVLPDAPAVAAKRLLLVGLGPAKTLSPGSLGKAMQTAARRVSEKPIGHVAVVCPEVAVEALGRCQTIETTVTALVIGSVGQGLYQREARRFPCENATLLIPTETEISTAVESVRRGQIIGEAVNLTRELVNRPASDIYPESVAEAAQRVASESGLQCEVLAGQQLEDERMGALLAVAQGSDRPARVVVLRYSGAQSADQPTLALVGKGVTFDSGGLSLKPSDGMKTMKCDMTGAATVVGALAAIARLQLPVNVVGYLGLVENMVNGSSYKLGDVLRARNGTTIEVMNTDAEGRLVLADVLSLAIDRGASHVVDLATLTGACVVALGEEISGVFSNNQSWCDQVMAAGRVAGEELWQLPLFEEYGEQLKSDVADCKNVGKRWGGAITAAKFLEKFVGEAPWVHLDIAGPAFAESNSPAREGGATGCMVRGLIALAEDYGKV